MAEPNKVVPITPAPVKLSVVGSISPDKLVSIASKNNFAKRKVSIKTYRLDDEDGNWIKVMSYGPPGAGKTNLILGMLLNGERVYVVNTDMGGNGLGTIKRRLKKMGRADLLANIAFADFSTYEEFQAFIENPEVVNSDTFKLWDFNPTVLVWEGVSFWQIALLDEEVLSHASVAKDGQSNVELRNEGMFAERADWNVIRRLTIRTANHFLNIHNPYTGDRVSKYCTFQESEPEKDDKGKLVINGKVKPLIYTAANTLMGAGFDLIVQLVARNKGIGADSSTDFLYRTLANDRVYGKNRAFDVPPEMPADPEDLWKRLKAA